MDKQKMFEVMEFFAKNYDEKSKGRNSDLAVTAGAMWFAANEMLKASGLADEFTAWQESKEVRA